MRFLPVVVGPLQCLLLAMSQCRDATIATQIIELLAGGDKKALLTFPV
jgi:hypothetical protein